MPFYLVALSTTFSSRLDVTLIEFLADKTEVGWYGAAANVAGLALLLTPLIGWVLLPLSSRSGGAWRRSWCSSPGVRFERILTLAIPVSLTLALGADVIVAILFGEAFAPATPALRVLSGMFVLTYAAMGATTALMRLGRSWYVTRVPSSVSSPRPRSTSF